MLLPNAVCQTDAKLTTWNSHGRCEIIDSHLNCISTWSALCALNRHASLNNTVKYAVFLGLNFNINICEYLTSQTPNSRENAISRILWQKSIIRHLFHPFIADTDLLCSDLSLKNPIYAKTSCYGHFGRSCFTWEQPKQLMFSKDIQNKLESAKDQIELQKKLESAAGQINGKRKRKAL